MYHTILTLSLSQVTAGKKKHLNFHHKSKENFSAFSETKNCKINKPKVEIVQYANGGLILQVLNFYHI